MKNHLHLLPDSIGIYASYVAFLFKFHELNMLLIIDMKVEITALPYYEFQKEKFKEQVAFPLRKQFVNPQNFCPEFF
jgi:hypothetical protein